MFLRFFCTLILSYSLSLAGEEKPLLLVTQAPYLYLVSQIAGENFDVMSMVPPAASAHTYEPTPKEMIQASKAAIWFFLGEPFEQKALDAMHHANPSMEFVDLKSGINLIKGTCSHAHAHGHCSADLHIWLDPLLAKKQAGLIHEALIKKYPSLKEELTKRFDLLAIKLEELDRWIRDKVRPLPHKNLMVSHPAYGYFCLAYGFTQISVEMEGRDPTAKQLTQILNWARGHSLHFILTQPQYSDKAARRIASELNLELVSVDPYAQDYDANLRQIVTLIVEHSR